MKKFKNEIFRYLILGLVALTMNSCNLIFREYQRHNAVMENKLPPNSFWNGGADGGEWVSIELTSDSVLVINTYHEILYEQKASYSFTIECGGISVKQIKNAFILTTGVKVVFDYNVIPKKCLTRVNKKDGS